MHHRNTWRVVLAVSIWALAAAARADEVSFKNGDRLTGKIETMEGGKLTIKSAVAGKITVDLKDIKTFSTEQPIDVRLSDGTILHKKIDAADDGQVKVAGGDIAGQAIALSSFKSINPAFGAWTGSVVLGGNLARGNTSTESFNASLHLLRRGEKDRITLDGGYLWGRERVPGVAGKRETENDWFVSPKYDYFFTQRFYGYANARVERDLIAQLSLLFTPGAGVGYQWVEKPDFHFNTEVGGAWLYRDFRNDGATESAAVRAAYHLDKKLLDRVSFFHDFEYYPALDTINNYYFNTDAGVKTQLTEKMFAELKGEYKYNSVPAPGKQHSDLRFLLGVGWAF